LGYLVQLPVRMGFSFLGVVAFRARCPGGERGTQHGPTGTCRVVPEMYLY
jgi:hypothetical protein